MKCFSVPAALIEKYSCGQECLFRMEVTAPLPFSKLTFICDSELTASELIAAKGCCSHLFISTTKTPSSAVVFGCVIYVLTLRKFSVHFTYDYLGTTYGI